jgi:hypothetical protein
LPFVSRTETARGGGMAERRYFDRPDVYVLTDYDDARQGGRVLRVVCEHPAGA